MTMSQAPRSRKFSTRCSSRHGSCPPNQTTPRAHECSALCASRDDTLLLLLMLMLVIVSVEITARTSANKNVAMDLHHCFLGRTRPRVQIIHILRHEQK